MHLGVVSAHVVGSHFGYSISKSTASRCFFVPVAQLLLMECDQCLPRYTIGMN
jgi:hypothetical protein